MRLCSFRGIAAIVATATSLQASAQSSQTFGQQEPTYRSTARTVVVDVVVSKGDQPILGLHKQDFQVFEDGKPQTIDFFEEHSSKTLPAGAIPSLPKMPPGVYTNVPPAPENDSVNVLLLDALNTDKDDQVNVHNQIMQFLKTMQPGTRTAIFTLSSRLRMVQGFTSDSSALVAALNDPRFGDLITKPTESRSMQDKKDDVRHINTMVMMDNGHWTAGIEAVDSFQHDFASVQAGQRVGMTLEALQALSRYLSAVPGRKNLIWFSSSFPISVFPNRGSQHPNQMNTSDPRDYNKAIRETADMLTISKIAVYPIGAEGVMSEHVAEAEVWELGGIDYEGGEPGQGGKGSYTAPYMHEGSARSDKIMAMEQLAIDTGGKAFFNTNDLNAATKKAIADGAHYYTFAYAPTNKKMDGSYRRIEVTVPDGKYRLSYRHGYNADNTAQMVATKGEVNPLHAIMMRGMPEATEIMYAARVVPSSPQPVADTPHAGRNAKLTGPTTRYSIDFLIRWTDVKLDAASDGNHTGKLQIETLAYDRAGNALNWAGGVQAMNLKPDVFAAIQKSGVPAHGEIDVPSGKDIYLATGVYDWETGRAGTLEVPLLLNEGTTTKSATLAQTK